MKNYEVKSIIETGAECLDIIPDDSEIMADSVEEAIDYVICDLMEQATYSDYNAERYDNYKVVIYDLNNSIICVYKFKARLTFDNKEIEGAEWEEPEYCDTVTDTTEEAKRDIIKKYEAEGLTEAGQWVPLFNDLIDNAETDTDALHVARERMLKKGLDVSVRVRAYYYNRITGVGCYSHSWTEQPKAEETEETAQTTEETAQTTEETAQTTEAEPEAEATTETEQPKAEEPTQTTTEAETTETTAKTTETTEATEQPDTAERGIFMSKFSVELKIGGNWNNGVTYVQQATIIVDGRTLKEVEEKAISMYCDDIIKQYGETNNLEAIYNNIDKTTEATCSTCDKCVCEWSITARARRMKKEESYKYARNYSGVRYCYNGLYKGYTSEKICYIAFDPEYNKAQTTETTETQHTEATAQTTEATAETTETQHTEATAETTETQHTEATAETTETQTTEATAETTETQHTEATTQTTEATAETTETQHTEATAQTEQPKAEEPTQATTETTEATAQPAEETAQPAEVTTTGATPPPTEETPPPTETTGKEVTGVTIIERRQYNNGDKVIIKHNCFYNADEIIDNYHATDPSYICKYKGLMFGKDNNDYYVSEFHYEEQYL